MQFGGRVAHKGLKINGIFSNIFVIPLFFTILRILWDVCSLIQGVPLNTEGFSYIELCLGQYFGQLELKSSSKL